MMNFEVILLTSTSVTIELKNNEVYETTSPYSIKVNDELISDNIKTNVYSIYHLEPETEYKIAVSDNLTQSMSSQTVTTHNESICINVKRFNAKGDGINDDTLAIQTAIMACLDHGRVVIPKGTYLVNSIFLKSNMTLEIEKDATLIYNGSSLTAPILPGYLTKTDGSEYYLGSWEGNPLDNFSSVLQAINVENVCVIGEGIIDGNGNAGWWETPKDKGLAWRARVISILHSKHVKLQGLTVQNSPCWTIHAFCCEHLIFSDLKIKNPKDSPNTDGLNPECCENVLIVGVHFSVGDDCIAIKSGKIYLGQKLKRPSQQIIIRNCSMNFGHGAVVIGSEMSGGVKDVLVTQCLFNETDRGLRIKTRRGRGCAAIIENIKFINIKMTKVLSPFVTNMYYFCDPDGHTPYVYTKERLPIDHRTPLIKDLYFENITCIETEVVAGFFFGLPEQPIQKISIKNFTCHYALDAKASIPAMMDNIREYEQEGLIFTNVETVVLENVEFENLNGPCVVKESVKEFVSEHVIEKNSRSSY